jgi:hypothetical protein
MSEVMWKKGHHRALWHAEYRGWNLRIESCNLGYQWVAYWMAGEVIRGCVEATVPEAQAAAIAAVDRQI